MAIQNANHPDADDRGGGQIRLTRFADTELKSMALQLAADAAKRKGDSVKAVVYAQSALEADPKNTRPCC